jgi:hypothetical protein
MKTMKKVITKQDFSVDWLLASKFYVDLPPGMISRILVLGYLYRSIKSGNSIGILQEITKGISQTQLYAYRKNNFSVSGGKINQLKLLENTLLKLNIKDRQTDRSTGHTLTILHRELMEESESRTISIQKAKEIRENLIKEEEQKTRKFNSVNEIEEVALNICQMFASGLISIYESCSRYGVSYLEFFKWVIGMETVREMYEDAVRVAKFVTESQIYTVTANMVLERLKAGYTSSTDIVWDAIWVMGKKVFVEKAKRTNTREITISELIRVIVTLKNESGIPAIDGDDFSAMSDNELFDHIKEMSTRINQKKSKVEK